MLFGFTAWSVPVIMAAASDDVLDPPYAPQGWASPCSSVWGRRWDQAVAGALADAAGGFAVAFLVAAAAAALELWAR